MSTSKSKRTPRVKDPVAVYYTRNHYGDFHPIGKGYGGKKSQIKSGKFVKPPDMPMDSDVLFSDGTRYSMQRRADLQGDYSEKIAELNLKQKETNKKAKK